MADELLYEVDDGVATVTLNRPDQRNALNGELLEALVDAMRAARDDDAVRAVVLTGAGDKVFCAGADLGGFRGRRAPRRQALRIGPVPRVLPADAAARQALSLR